MKKSFKIDIKQSVIDDLKSSIANTRWTDEIENSKWEYGTNKTYLKELCKYWEKTFDWKKQEQYLNPFHHFKTIVDGVELHYIHQKGEGKNSIPLFLTHGYPDSFVRFLKIITLLTKADENGFSFDVIVPSTPGYGFSDIPTEKGMNTKLIASVFAKLIQQWAKMPKGGHFAAMEQPELLAEDIRKFVTGIQAEKQQEKLETIKTEIV